MFIKCIQIEFQQNILSELLQNPGNNRLLESFQCLLFPQDYQKIIKMKQEAFSGIGASLQAWLGTEHESLIQDWLGKELELTMSELKTVSLLASEGYLTSVYTMNFVYTNTTGIPSDQVEKLASIVTEEVRINNMTPISQLGSILASVKCRKLALMDMRMSSADTIALVAAMRDRVETVELCHGLTLDIMELTTYDGRGSCKKIRVYSDTRTMLSGFVRHVFQQLAGPAQWDDTRRRHKDMLRMWAKYVGWYVRQDNMDCLVIGKENKKEGLCQTQ